MPPKKKTKIVKDKGPDLAPPKIVFCRAKPVQIIDLTIDVDLTSDVDLTIDDDEISDLTNDSSSSTSSRVLPWKSGDWCWLIPEKNDDEVIDLTNHDYEISYLTNNDDEISHLTNESRGKKQTK